MMLDQFLLSSLFAGVVCTLAVGVRAQSMDPIINMCVRYDHQCQLTAIHLLTDLDD